MPRFVAGGEPPVRVQDVMTKGVKTISRRLVDQRHDAEEDLKRHARAIPGPHRRYHVFLDYGDASGYRKHLPALRQAMRAGPHHGAGKRRRAVDVHGGR